MIVALFVGLVTLATAVAISSASPRGSGAAQSQAGTTLSVNDCIQASVGDTVNVSISIRNVTSVIAWEVYFAYDREMLEVVGRDVRLFLSEGANSNVFDLSDPVPNSTGLYRLAAADVALGGTAESGDGVLATITLRAHGEGVSPAAIYRTDVVPLGPRITTVGGAPIGDGNGDGIFDGPIESGQIAVGRSCSPTPPSASPDLGDAIPSVSPTFTVTSVPGPTPTTRPGDPTPDQGGTGRPNTDGPTGPGGSAADPSPAENGTSVTPDGTGIETDRPVGIRNGGGGGGITSTSNNTFWAIVLIGGGIGLGLVVTYVFARMTRRPA